MLHFKKFILLVFILSFGCNSNKQIVKKINTEFKDKYQKLNNNNLYNNKVVL